MIRQRILFVDDDPNILAGLENRLHKDRARWDMAFVSTGAAAIAAFAAGGFDIVVCDMCMPGMDGAELLERIQSDYPETTRIVLSGQAEREGVIRALPFTHQFLSKPCDGKTLRDVLERACDLRSLLANHTVKEIIGRVDRLPSVPSIYWELVNAVTRNDAGTAEIAAIVERDPSMTAKILQLVNSAYFGLAQHISSIQQALVYLGVDLVKGLTLTNGVFECRSGSRVSGPYLAALQKHSLLTAQLARRFVANPKIRDEVFTAAMVHNIGEVVLAEAYPDYEAEIAANLKRFEGQRYLAERELFGATHAEVGAYLLGIWGLPFSIVEAVAFHHEPARATVADAELLALVHVADVLVDRAAAGPGGAKGGARGTAQMDLVFLESVGLTSRLREWEAIAARNQ